MAFNSRINNDELDRIVETEEPRFLSIVLKDKESLMDAISFPIKGDKRGHFSSTKCQVLYDYISSYYLEHNAILTRTAMDSLVKTNPISDIDESALMMYYDKVYNINVPVEDYSMLKTHLNHRYVQWQAWEVLQKRIKELVNATSNQDEIVKSIRDDFNHIDNLEVDPYALAMNFSDGIEKAIEHIKDRRDHPEQGSGILCGIKAIDDMYYGFDKGSYTVISGMVNGGKTTLMLNIGFNIARAGYNVVYVSLEKKAIPVFERLLALHGLIDYNRIKRGGKGEFGLSDYYYQKYIESADDLRDRIKPNFDIIQAVQDTKLSKIFSETDKIFAKKHVDLLIVDYLGVVGLETNTPGRPDLDIARTSMRLQAYGRVHNTATITGLQIGNSAAKDIKKRAQKATEDSDFSHLAIGTEDLTLSQRIMADADNGISIVLNSDSPPTKAFVHSTKSRETESKVTKVLDFDGRIGRISDPELDTGQIKGVDEILFNKEITEDQIQSDDDLFGSTPVSSSVFNDEDGDDDLKELYDQIPEEVIENDLPTLDVENKKEKSDINEDSDDDDDWLNEVS